MLLHIYGGTNTIIEEMACCGADTISVDQKNNLSESRKKLEADVILLGNIDPWNVLMMGNPEQVDTTAKEIIADGVNGIWPGCDIWPLVPWENM